MNARTRALVASVATVGALLAGAPFALASDETEELTCSAGLTALRQADKAVGKAEKALDKAKDVLELAEAELARVTALPQPSVPTPAAAQAVRNQAKKAVEEAEDSLAEASEELEEAKSDADGACKGEDGKDAPALPTVQAPGEKVVTIVRERQVDVVPSTDDGVETGGL